MDSYQSAGISKFVKLLHYIFFKEVKKIMMAGVTFTQTSIFPPPPPPPPDSAVYSRLI